MAVKIDIEALDLISVLGQEMIVSYEAEDETIDTIVTDLLAFQLRTPVVTKGTISASYASLTRSIVVDGDTILRALYRLHETIGGYINVDNSRRLQWTSSIGEDKGQQIRYNKNLKGIARDIDYHQMINRLYAYGSGEGEARIVLSDADGQDEDYIKDQTSHDDWGGWYPGSVKDPSITHPDTLLAWATLKLAELKDPVISYTVDVVDLSESSIAEFQIESLQLGSIVKVIDEDLGIDVSVSIVEMNHSDLNNPLAMTIELSNRTRDITDVLTEVYDIQQFGQHLATQIGAGQVTVLGGFTVRDWITGGETTIDGANIETGTLTLGTLNFVALTSSGDTGEIVATINASTEGAGVRITGDRITLDGDVICTGDFEVLGSIKTGETLIVYGDISAGGGKVNINSTGIWIDAGVYLQVRDTGGGAEGTFGGGTGFAFLSAVDTLLISAPETLIDAGKDDTGDVKFRDDNLATVASIYTRTDGSRFYLVPETDGTGTLGLITEAFAEAHIDSLVCHDDTYMAGSLTFSASGKDIVGPFGAGSLMGTLAIYPEQTNSDEYNLHCKFPSFDQEDDIALLRGIDVRDGLLDVDTFPDAICNSPDLEKEEGVINKVMEHMTKEEKELFVAFTFDKLSHKAVSVGNWQSLLMGAILQLADKVEALNQKVSA